MQGYPILNLFLLANLVTTTSTLPVLLGLLEGPIASRLFTPLSTLFGCWFSFASIVVYGRIMLPSWGGTMSDVSCSSLHSVSCQMLLCCPALASCYLSGFVRLASQPGQAASPQEATFKDDVLSCQHCIAAYEA